MITSRSFGRSVLILLACVALVPLPAGAATPASTPGGARNTFGTQPCGRLVSMEEVAAVFKESVKMIDIEEEGMCVYKGAAGVPLFSVRLTSGPKLRCTAKDGTYLGKPAEPVAGIGEQAVWCKDPGTFCFVKGETRMQLSFDSTLPEGTDRKAAAIDLARKAAARLPQTKGR